MAKQNYSFEKRQRELAKKKKQEEKRQKKTGKDDGTPEEGEPINPVPDPTDPPPTV